MNILGFDLQLIIAAVTGGFIAGLSWTFGQATAHLILKVYRRFRGVTIKLLEVNGKK